MACYWSWSISHQVTYVVRGPKGQEMEMPFTAAEWEDVAADPRAGPNGAHGRQSPPNGRKYCPLLLMPPIMGSRGPLAVGVCPQDTVIKVHLGPPPRQYSVEFPEGAGQG